MECKQNTNLKSCSCTYEPCPRKGMCCECVAYHRKSRQLPACFFDEEGERSYDRSYSNFCKGVAQGKI